MGGEVIDAEYRVVQGLRAGDEHPTRAGWFYSGQNAADGTPLMYKRFSLRALWGWCVLAWCVGYWCWMALRLIRPDLLD
jgi:hypothetical protein